MNKLNKLTSLLLSLALVLSLSVSGFAATVTPDDLSGPASITVTLPEGINGTNTYQIYKVFNATTKDGRISYTLVDGKEAGPAGFKVDAAGNVSYAGTATELTSEDIAAIANYVTESDLSATVVTAEGETSFTVSGLDYGYYFITTTTGSVVTVDSTNPNAQVSDKNTVPELSKTVTDLDESGKKAIAQVGTNVTFTVDITVGKGAKGYVFHDQMETGLLYNNDVSVTVGGAPVDGANFDTAAAAGDTLTITFADEYLATLEEGTVITISYSAKITSDALTVDPATNTAWLDYGDKNSTTKDHTDVYNAKFTVTKEDGDGEPLAGAGFVLKSEEGKFYKIEETVVSWVDSMEDATELISDDDGQVPAFTGLANGTYTLVEKTVPDGYNRAEDKTFTIESGDVTAENLEQSATVINNAGSELPSTGGMGTTLFYVFGGGLTLGAVLLLITKKRMGAEG